MMGIINKFMLTKILTCFPSGATIQTIYVASHGLVRTAHLLQIVATFF